MPDFSFDLEPFSPARGLSRAHAQTLAANLLRLPNWVTFRRERLETPDGDFLDLDFPTVFGYHLPAEAPLVLVLHGLEGSARRGYACEAYRQLARRGIRAVGLNYRSCSGEMNRTARFYHAGSSDDVMVAWQWLEAHFPATARGMIGFSLGANILLVTLGQGGSQWDGRLQAAVSISSPFDLAASVQVMDHGSGRFYLERFLSSMRDKAAAKRALLDGKLDLARVMAARTFRELDDAFATLHGFASADDYYARCSAGIYLPAIRVPTLLIRSLDDPLFAEDVPQERVAANPCLVPAITRRGGHVAFMEGFPWAPRFWAERQAARFLAAAFGLEPDKGP